jgi:ribonuclease HI
MAMLNWMANLVTWVAPYPTQGTVFVNSDAAFFEDIGCRGAGAIIRDHHGNCLVASRQFMAGLSSSELAEAHAFQRAVELARNEGLDKVIFETDCLSLLNWLNSTSMDRSAVGIVIAGIKHLVKDFASVSFRHVKRGLNEAAHLLAKSCSDTNSSFVSYSVPDFIQGSLYIDVV